MPDSLAARAAFKRVLWLSVLAPLVVMTLLAIALVVQVTSLLAQSRAVEHTDEVITRLYRLEATLLDGQSGVRGFMLSGDEAMLETFNAMLRDLPAQMAELRWITRDRPEAGRLCDEFGLKARGWINFVQQRTEERRRAGVPLPYMSTSPGLISMSAARGTLNLWLSQEIALRVGRNARVQRWANGTIVGVSAMTLIVGTLLAFLGRGQLRWLSTTYEGALARSRDLSASLEQRVEERTHELSISNGELGEANKELEAFAYSISHDLRAPMRHITGFADLLRRSLGKQISTDDAENLDIIYNTAVLAGRMVDDLLAFSRVGRTQLRSAPVDVNDLVKQCVTELQPETRGRQIEWVIHDLAPTRGDASLLRMVFQNLLANAVKYTQKREAARIEVASTRHGASTTYVIRDNGVGFEMAYVHKLFGVFQRLHRSEDFEGTGIGLANVRRIIVRHGGQVRAEGVPEAGAAFYVDLPN